MISGKVDLTEHRDFSLGPGLVSFREQIELIRQEQVLELEDALFMSLDDYNKLSRYHKIFGTRRHSNEKERVFDYEGRHERYWKETCVRCGRPLRIPWNRCGELCKYCDEIVDDRRIPWKGWKSSESERQHSADEIFSLR